MKSRMSCNVAISCERQSTPFRFTAVFIMMRKNTFSISLIKAHIMVHGPVTWFSRTISENQHHWSPLLCFASSPAAHCLNYCNYSVLKMIGLCTPPTLMEVMQRALSGPLPSIAAPATARSIQVKRCIQSLATLSVAPRVQGQV